MFKWLQFEGFKSETSFHHSPLTFDRSRF